MGYVINKGEYKEASIMLNNGVPLSAAYNQSMENKVSDNNKLVPGKGSIILYNEIIKWQDRKMTRPFRGCGVVSGMTDHLVLIDNAIIPGFFVKTAIPKTDFILGIVKYVYLKEVIYKKDVTYNELNIYELSEKIRELVINF